MYGNPQFSGRFIDENGQNMEIWWYGKLPQQPSQGKVMLDSALVSFAEIFFLPHISPEIDGFAEEKFRSFIGADGKEIDVNYLQKNYLLIVYFNEEGNVISNIWTGKEKCLQPPMVNRLLQQKNSNRKVKGASNVVQEESTVITKEPKHVYVDGSQTCHKPDCAQIRGIEKRTLKRFESLEQALQAENKKCDSCMVTE